MREGLWLLAALVVVAGPAPGDQPAPPAAQPDDPVGRALVRRGYVRVPLTPTKAGMLDLAAEANGVALRLVLDTGANNLNLDRAWAKRAKLAVEEVAEKTSGTGGVVSAGKAKIERLALGGITEPAETCVLDLGAVNALRKVAGDPPCDGILGGSVLNFYAAVIDYPHHALYLRPRGRKAKAPARLLRRGGHASVPLTYNKTGLLDVKAEVDGVPVLLFLDSGANATLSLDPGAARRAKLAVKEAGKSAELGGAVSRGRAPVGKFVVGRAVAPADADVLPFDPTNGTRKGNGDPVCDGSLGSRYLAARRAVIDYGRRRLYLTGQPAWKPAEPGTAPDRGGR